MIILDNEYVSGTRIVYKDGNYGIKNRNQVGEIVDGIGVLTNKGELVGVF